jgi:hypothetical protein
VELKWNSVWEAALLIILPCLPGPAIALTGDSLEATASEQHQQAHGKVVVVRGSEELKLLYDSTSRAVRPEARIQLSKLQAKSPQRWRVRWSKTTGGAESINGGMFAAKGATLREKAESFLSEYLDIFLPEDTAKAALPWDFRFDMERSWQIYLNQYVQGLRVFDSYMVVLFQHDTIDQVSCYGRVIKDLDLMHEVGANAAFDRIVTTQTTGNLTFKLSKPPELVIFPSDPPRLMWVVYCSTTRHVETITHRFMVDARTGEVMLDPLVGVYRYQKARGASEGAQPDTQETVPRDTGQSDGGTSVPEQNDVASFYCFQLADSFAFAGCPIRLRWDGIRSPR